jgi:hypothetical protein
MKKKYVISATISEVDPNTGIKIKTFEPIDIKSGNNIIELSDYINSLFNDESEDLDNIKEQIEYENRLFAKYMGYYQPEDFKDADEMNNFSFEVFAHLENAELAYPDSEINLYYNDEVEDFEFIDEPNFNLDYLMMVARKLTSEKQYHTDFLYLIIKYFADKKETELRKLLLKELMEISNTK